MILTNSAQWVGDLGYCGMLRIDIDHVKREIIMKQLPIGIQTFSKLIEDGFEYVDKTALIHELITSISILFFISSTTFWKISFSFNIWQQFLVETKNCLQGLLLHHCPYDWKQHPVVMISFSDILIDT